MTLNTLWFILIGVLFTGFFFLEGFDYGVGILLPFLGKKDEERRMIINTIGPVWDGNEVWLLTAGGAMFAAFPNWYATLFSGFYLALLLMLVALIVRGVAFEFRSKDKHPALARPVGLVHLRRQLRAGAAVGRGDGEHRARGADRRGHAVCRRLLQPAEPVRPAGRPGRGRRVDAARRDLPQPAHHGRDAGARPQDRASRRGRWRPCCSSRWWSPATSPPTSSSAWA